MTEYEICMENCGCTPEEDTVESRLMAMTFWAHKAALFEKIKEKIEKEEGEKLEKIADLLVEASKNRWSSRQEAQKKREELKEKIKDAFED